MSVALKALAAHYKYKVSILIPAYNEESSILFILNKIIKTQFSDSYEIIIVNDGSTDKTQELVEGFIKKHPQHNIQCFYQKNQGKGGAIHRAITEAQGEILLVQDADLEYDPQDYPKLLLPFEHGQKVVYGSRNLNPSDRKHSSLFFYWGGILVTVMTNLLFGSKLTDEATGYKVFHASLFAKLNFYHKDFAWEPEITAKILKQNITIFEVPISYQPRSKKEGKKISWKDGVKAVWILIQEYFKKS